MKQVEKAWHGGKPPEQCIPMHIDDSYALTSMSPFVASR